MDTLLAQLERLAYLDPYALFSAILMLCVVAGCLTLVFRAIRFTGLAVLVVVAVFCVAVLWLVGRG